MLKGRVVLEQEKQDSKLNIRSNKKTKQKKTSRS